MARAAEPFRIDELWPFTERLERFGMAGFGWGAAWLTPDGDVDTHLLADLTRWCADREVMPEGLTVGRRSLEDVFLDLTGSDLRA